MFVQTLFNVEQGTSMDSRKLLFQGIEKENWGEMGKICNQ